MLLGVEQRHEPSDLQKVWLRRDEADQPSEGRKKYPAGHHGQGTHGGHGEEEGLVGD